MKRHSSSKSITACFVYTPFDKISKGIDFKAVTLRDSAIQVMLVSKRQSAIC
jgi:hypothetical protein